MLLFCTPVACFNNFIRIKCPFMWPPGVPIHTQSPDSGCGAGGGQRRDAAGPAGLRGQHTLRIQRAGTYYPATFWNSLRLLKKKKFN